ncbi:signal recognition particle, SRP19 subunit [Phakopsora pachyrhizi]|uniref:Signal recognition particle, SRP19 subunit n=1 Tax=Phakopsora pachyrhizi TaxID=170000 RepID=A0AAV0BEW3_PHAPC|nr:signal recognition particle, SRP19 subunit [Phakopsora pachyrhizi]CAH7685802.1 signal recognition particle, SRP19 subunit [Phakopsora pachyrhizi]
MPNITELTADEIDDFDFPLVVEDSIRSDQRPTQSSSQNPFNMSDFPDLLAGMMGVGTAGFGQHKSTEPDDSEWKKWETIYPRYLDSKAPFKSGGRRVNLKHSLRFPLAQHIYEVCCQLGFKCQLESHKTHPADWENPGRVKVQIKIDGKPVNRSIPNKFRLLCRIGALLRPLESQRLRISAVEDKRSRWLKTLPNIVFRLPQNSPAISHGFLAMAESETKSKKDDGSSTTTITRVEKEDSSGKDKTQTKKASVQPNQNQKSSTEAKKQDNTKSNKAVNSKKKKKSGKK